MAFVVIMHGVCLSMAVKAFSDDAKTASMVFITFHSPLFWFYFLFIFPLITMRQFSDEQRSGTLETLLTAPVKTSQVVLAKYFACLVFYTLMWVPSVFQFYAFPWVTHYPAAWTGGTIVGAYMIIFLLGTFFIAIGCLCSALTSNAIVAAIFTIAVLVFHHFLGFVTVIWGESFAGAGFFNAISTQLHFQDFCSGLINSKVIVYYLSMAALTVFFTFHVLDLRRWRK